MFYQFCTVSLLYGLAHSVGALPYPSVMHHPKTYHGVLEPRWPPHPLVSATPTGVCDSQEELASERHLNIT